MSDQIIGAGIVVFAGVAVWGGLFVSDYLHRAWQRMRARLIERRRGWKVR